MKKSIISGNSQSLENDSAVRQSSSQHPIQPQFSPPPEYQAPPDYQAHWQHLHEQEKSQELQLSVQEINGFR